VKGVSRCVYTQQPWGFLFSLRSDLSILGRLLAEKRQEPTENMQ
jgi:hypothetical protein